MFNLSYSLMAASFTQKQLIAIIVVGLLLIAFTVADIILIVKISKQRHKHLRNGHDALLNQLEEARKRHAAAVEAVAAARAAQQAAEAEHKLALQKAAAAQQAADETADVVAVKSPKVITEDLDDDDNEMVYNRSFRSKIIQSDDEVKEWYSELKNELLSYKGVKTVMHWKHESFRLKRRTLVRMTIRGKTLCLYFAIEPEKFAASKIKVEDVSDIAQYQGTPSLFRIKSKRRLGYAMKVIQFGMNNLGETKIEREHVDYYEPYVGTVQLIKRGLVKRIVRKTREKPKFLTKEEKAAAAAEAAAVAAAEKAAELKEEAALAAVIAEERELAKEEAMLEAELAASEKLIEKDELKEQKAAEKAMEQAGATEESDNQPAEQETDEVEADKPAEEIESPTEEVAEDNK